MSEESALSKKNLSEKFILDATAGYRMMWLNKHHPNCIYLDEKPECEPDIVGDFRDLKQFKDETFRLIVFDPPHIVRKKHWNNTAEMEKIFGFLTVETWQSDLKQAFTELWRVLKSHGILIFKWSDYSATLENVLKLSPVPPLFCQKINRKINSKHKESFTSWCCFMKIPEEKEE